MIFDTLDNAPRLFALNPHFESAFAWLQANPDAAIGRYDIDGDNCYVMIQRIQGRGKTNPIVEAHNRYLDIHVTLEGVEEIGWMPRAACEQVRQEFDAAGDAALWNDTPGVYIPLAPGQFAIVYPEDAHAPCSGTGEVLKAVFKIVV